MTKFKTKQEAEQALKKLAFVPGCKFEIVKVSFWLGKLNHYEISGSSTTKTKEEINNLIKSVL